MPATFPYPEPTQSTLYPPHPTSWRSILILSSHLRLGLPIGLFHTDFLTKPLYTTLLSPPHTCYMPRKSRSSIWPPEQYLVKNRDHQAPHYVVFLHSPVTSSLLGPDTLFSPLFSNTLSLRSSLNMSDQVSHPYIATGKIIVVCVLIFVFLDNELEDKDSYFCITREKFAKNKFLCI